MSKLKKVRRYRWGSLGRIVDYATSYNGHTHIYIYAHTFTSTYIRTHIYKHIHTHTHLQAHTYARTHTHTHALLEPGRPLFVGVRDCVVG